MHAPVLLVYGTRENWPLAGVRAYADSLPDVTITAVEGAGHHVWNEHRDEVAAMIAEFVGAASSEAERR